MMTAEQIVIAHKANVETLFGLTGLAFEGVEKLVGLNIQVAKTAMTEAAQTTQAALSVKDAQELMALQAGLLQPAAEKAAAYSRHVYEIAASTGADAVVVSNHGGRQLDGTVSSIRALPEVRDAVGDKLEVFFDGGVRSGQDVLKALALGARGVFIGKAFAWALGAMGEEGVTLALDIIRRELDVSMALCGLRDVKDASPAILRSA